MGITTGIGKLDRERMTAVLRSTQHTISVTEATHRLTDRLATLANYCYDPKPSSSIWEGSPLVCKEHDALAYLT